MQELRANRGAPRAAAGPGLDALDVELPRGFGRD